jgi:arginase
MERREFLICAAATMGAHLLPAQTHVQEGSVAGISELTYHILGVPLRAGSLVPGNENDAQAYRDVQFIARMHSAGIKAVDDGDVAIPSYLPHHSIPPIRSWPAPRIAWECVSERVTALLKSPSQVPLLIGCDCSVVVGTTQALQKTSNEEVHVLYVDGDFDDAAPEAVRANSAAACAVWLLTNQSPFWAGPPLQSSQVTVIGWSSPSKSLRSKVGSISLADIRRLGARAAGKQVLQSIPTSASLLLHFDIDVLQRKAMAAAYFPHQEGLAIGEVTELLGSLLEDPRIRIVEISEYAALRDLDQQNINELVGLLCEAMRKK